MAQVMRKLSAHLFKIRKHLKNAPGMAQSFVGRVSGDYLRCHDAQAIALGLCLKFAVGMLGNLVS